MEQLVIAEKLSSAIKWAAVILAVAIVFSASAFKRGEGRYSFTPQKDNWVLVGDTKSGRSWSCVTKFMFEDENNKSYFSELPLSFEGCLAISIPSKVQRDVSYQGN
ncbi:MAG: hypothetical protein Q7T88_03625 [Methylotenera sp.]|nr:hypothetical protein [Methylotenera sp.]